MIECLKLTEKQIREASHVCKKISAKFRTEQVGVVETNLILSGDFSGPTYVFHSDKESPDSFYFLFYVESSIYDRDRVFEDINLNCGGRYTFNGV